MAARQGRDLRAPIEVAIGALKMCGTSGALMGNTIGRALRDTAMGLVQAFPPERGKLDLPR